MDRSSRIRGEGPTVNNLESILLSKVVDAKRATLQSQVIRWREARRPKSDGNSAGSPMHGKSGGVGCGLTHFI